MPCAFVLSKRNKQKKTPAKKNKRGAKINHFLRDIYQKTQFYIILAFYRMTSTLKRRDQFANFAPKTRIHLNQETMAGVQLTKTKNH